MHRRKSTFSGGHGGRFMRASAGLLGFLSAWAMAGSTVPTRAPGATPATGRTLGFVMTTFEKATYLGSNDCPSGFVQRGIDGLLASVSKSERDRINRPGSAKERKQLETLSKAGELCYRPDWLPAPPHRTVQGKISYGM